jgi:hypothetical protein
LQTSKKQRDEIIQGLAKEILKKEPHLKDETVTHVPKEKVDKLKE